MSSPKVALTPKQLEAIQLMVYKCIPEYQVCKDVGICPNTLTKWKRQDEFKEELRHETERHLGFLAQKAVKRMGELMDSGNESVALGACKEVLNKSGYKEAQKVEQTTTVIDLDVKE